MNYEKANKLAQDVIAVMDKSDNPLPIDKVHEIYGLVNSRALDTIYETVKDILEAEEVVVESVLEFNQEIDVASSHPLKSVTVIGDEPIFYDDEDNELDGGSMTANELYEVCLKLWNNDYFVTMNHNI